MELQINDSLYKQTMGGKIFEHLTFLHTQLDQSPNAVCGVGDLEELKTISNCGLVRFGTSVKLVSEIHIESIWRRTATSITSSSIDRTTETVSPQYAVQDSSTVHIGCTDTIIGVTPNFPPPEPRPILQFSSPTCRTTSRWIRSISAAQTAITSIPHHINHQAHASVNTTTSTSSFRTSRAL